MAIKLRILILAVALTAAPSAAAAQALPEPEAWAALEAGNASKAAAMFRDALERSPSNALLHFGSAQAALVLGRTDTAISALKHATEYKPDFLPAFLMLAQVAYQSADLDLAVASLEKAAALAPRRKEIATKLAEWRKESTLHQNFQTRPGVRFNVLFEGPAQKATSDRVSAALEAAYSNIGRTLNLYPASTLDVILYSTKQFQDITRAPGWADGGYDGRIRLKVAGALRSPNALDRVVNHEYAHAVIGAAAGETIPAWLNEGLASYLESDDHSWARRVLQSSNERIELSDLEDGFGGFDGATALVAYAESLIAAELICERLKPHVGPFLQLLGSGHTVDQALSSRGIRPESFHAEWRKRVGMPTAAR